MLRFSRTRIFIGAVICVILAVGAGIWLVWASRGFTHQGKTVDEWIMLANVAAPNPEDGVLGEIALQDMDPEFILPILAEALAREEVDEPLNLRMHSYVFKKAGGSWPGWLPAPAHWNTNIIQFRNNTARLIRLFGPDVQIIQPQLGTLLLHDEPLVRFFAASSLLLLETNVVSSLPVMIQAMEEGKQSTSLVRLIRKSRATEALPVLKLFKTSGTLDEKIEAARAIAAIDPDQEHEALEILSPALDSEEPAVQIGVAEALWEIHHDAAFAMPYVTALLQNKDHPFFGRTLRLVSDMGADAKELVPIITPHLKSTRPWRRRDAAAALWSINGDPHEVLPVLIPLLDERLQERSTAELLEEIGGPARQALPRLRRIVADHKDRKTVEAASNAVRRIEFEIDSEDETEFIFEEPE